MRAYLHYLAARMYGEIVYIDRKIAPTESMDFKKESFHTIVAKIVQDCDSAYARVPATWGGADFGRIDKGACLGLKAISRWMAATPMWNGGTLPNDSRQFKGDYTYSQARWVQARDAAKALIDFKADGAPRYSLYVGHDQTDFKDDVGTNNNNSKVYARLWDMYFSMDAYLKEAVFFVTKDNTAVSGAKRNRRAEQRSRLAGSGQHQR